MCETCISLLDELVEGPFFYLSPLSHRNTTLNLTPPSLPSLGIGHGVQLRPGSRPAFSGSGRVEVGLVGSGLGIDY